MQPVKQPINIDFSKGLNLKVDPYQVQVGNFLSLVNTTFDNVGALTKRNGFRTLTTLPNTTTSYLTTFNDDLQAIGPSLLAYSSGQDAWIAKGSTHPIRVSTIPLIRNSVNQSQVDTAVSPNGLVCVVYTEQDAISANTYKYAISDSTTGQSIVAPTVLSTATGTPRVYVVGNYFIILYTSGTSTTALNYLAISYLNTSAPLITAVVASSYTAASTVSYDAIFLNSSLFIAYNGASSTGIHVVSLSPTLTLSSSVIVDSAHSGTILSLAADNTNQTLWVTYWATASGAYAIPLTPALIPLHAAVLVIATGTTILNIASVASSNILTFFYEVSNNYSYDSGIPTHFINKNTLTLAGTVGTAITSVRSVGLASKAFMAGTDIYYLATYQSPYQPTYFLIDGATSTQASPVVVAKLAYSNGGGYLVNGLPNITMPSVTQVMVPYLYKDLVAAVNKDTNVLVGTQVNGIYSQLGVNLATFNIDTQGLSTAETGSNLLLSGGFLWSYDGYTPVEQNFFLWPDSVEGTYSTTGGSMHAEPDGSTNANAYYYQVVYEWTDNQGNQYYSAPSIPISITTTGSATTGSVTLNIPTIRLTYKTASPAKVCVYRWSVAQQTYYQVTALTFTSSNSLTLNSTTSDSVTFVDTLADATILGNNILYTTGGVVEDVNAPASNILTLFDDRLWLVDAEDPNLLWFSKQVIENTPVEMSDLLTFYVAPTTGAQGSTGNITALSPMDDKLIIFKSDAIYYVNGTGPDNTGSNSAYSQPIFITSSVGCSNQRSVVVMKDGLMFQSDKGIWLLGRDLSTQYIGAPVEDFNIYTVNSALSVPSTNQVRFGLSNGSTLMYDYFVGQWGQFQGISSKSATLYQGLHTYVNSYGSVLQESPGEYLDGPDPVLMSFTTSWLQLAGLRGYQRAYWFSLLGTYLSPHKLQVEVAYDYNSSATQSNLSPPLGYYAPYGSTSDPFYGSDGTTPYGGPSNIEQFRVFLSQQRCKAFQISITEVFDPTFGTVAGPGLTLSGLNCIVGVKKSYSPQPQIQQIG